MQRSSGPSVRKLITVAGLTTALGIPVAAIPASAHVVGTKTRLSTSASPTLQNGARAAAPSSLKARANRVSSSLNVRVLREASRHAGKPYSYGARGPSSFDCSGYVQYVYSRVGVSVPRTSRAQAAASRSVPKAAKRNGDLIIMRAGGRVTHVGIYAGSNTMWVARRSGTTITRQKLWTSNYRVGRFA